MFSTLRVSTIAAGATLGSSLQLEGGEESRFGMFSRAWKKKKDDMQPALHSTNLADVPSSSAAAPDQVPVFKPGESVMHNGKRAVIVAKLHGQDLYRISYPEKTRANRQKLGRRSDVTGAPVPASKIQKCPEASMDLLPDADEAFKKRNNSKKTRSRSHDDNFKPASWAGRPEITELNQSGEPVAFTYEIKREEDNLWLAFKYAKAGAYVAYDLAMNQENIKLLDQPIQVPLAYDGKKLTDGDIDKLISTFNKKFGRMGLSTKDFDNVRPFATVAEDGVEGHVSRAMVVSQEAKERISEDLRMHFPNEAVTMPEDSLAKTDQGRELLVVFADIVQDIAE